MDVALKTWWDTLNDAWQDILIDHLDLNGLFTPKDLGYLHTLTELNLHGEAIDDLDVLQMLPQLEYLDISFSQVSDLSPLHSLPNLRELHAIGLRQIDLSPLADMTQLEVLDISYPEETLISGHTLASLQGLREFYANGCGIQDMGDIHHLTGLEVLSLYFNPISHTAIDTYRLICPQTNLLF